MGTIIAPAGFGRPAWDAIRNARQVHGWGLVPIVVGPFLLDDTSAGGYATSYDQLFTVGKQSDVGYWKLESATITPGAAVAAAGTNGSSLDIVIGSGATFDDTNYPLVHVNDNGYTSLTQTLVKGSSFDLEIAGPEATTPRKVFLAAGDTVMLKQTELGTGRDLSTIPVTVTLWFRHSPPQR